MGDGVEVKFLSDFRLMLVILNLLMMLFVKMLL